MASVFISFSDMSLEQMANLIRHNVTAFDSVEFVSGQGILIKGADGKTYCRIASDIWTYFYKDGTDDPASASATLTANAYYRYLGITENGIIGCDANGGTKFLLTKSYHGEYAFLLQAGDDGAVKGISQTSSGIQQYSLGGGNADSQTILNYFPLKPGEHPFDCTPAAYLAQTFQSNTFMGLVSFGGMPYIQVKRWFLKGAES